MSRNLLHVLSFGTNLLLEHRIEQPRLESEILLSHLLKAKRVDLYIDHDKPVTEDEFSEYVKLLRRRTEGIPVQYLTNRVGFFSNRFLIEEGVFIPRRDTEVLVDALAGVRRVRVRIEVLLGGAHVRLRCEESKYASHDEDDDDDNSWCLRDTFSDSFQNHAEYTR